MSGDAAQLPGWAFWIDRGGTFTDIVARRPDGSLVVRKLLSESPAHDRDAAVAGVRAILAEADEPDAEVEAVKMGTTVATNALLERRGEPTLLAITAGHADALRIGYQARPRLFDRRIVLPEALYAEVVEIHERVSTEGEVLRPLDEARAAADLQRAFDGGLRAVAVVLMHGYRHTAHEARVAELARAAGFTQVSVSHRVSPLMKLVGRGDTTVADAYLSPILRRYVDRLEGELGRASRSRGPRLLFMQSNGGLVEAHAFEGKDAILSGPAGGVVGLARATAEAGLERVIGFDMGGTSTDVCRYAGRFERTTEAVVAGVRVRAPMMSINTVAAGGGSICRFDGARLRVGPQSAGAIPGPASYGGGGPLTVTDCNVMLGKLRPEVFPAVFGPGGDRPLDLAAVEARFAEVARAVEGAGGRAMTPPEIAQGFLTIAVENMAKAIRQVSIQRGYDVTAYALACFGGAGGQHACQVADALGMTLVMVHPLAGVLSAYGMGLADLRLIRQATVERPLAAAAGELAALAGELAADARAAVEAQRMPLAAVDTLALATLKYAGADTGLEVPLASAEAMRTDFEAAHRRRFGYVLAEGEVVVEAVSVEAVGRPHAVREAEASAPRNGAEPRAFMTAQVHMAGGGARATRFFRREALSPGAQITGPAILTEATGTTVVEPGWTARVDARLNLMLERATPLPTRLAVGAAVDPVRLELFNNAFMAVAEEMGLALQTTAHSVNIKERLDFSCAVFDASGALIANAPHIPVHLGSMGDSVRAIAEARRADGRGMRPGDAYMMNDPYRGGTHLPDVTVVTPVFAAGDWAGGQPAFYVAARGHQGDIGGTTPGSMPPDSRTIAEEGVLIEDFLLVDEGRLCEVETRALLASGPYPARSPDQTLGDLKAQVAACTRGAAGLLAMAETYGLEVVHAYMGHVQDNAADAVRRVVDGLQDGAFAYELDNGAVVRVAVRIDSDARRATVDFTGTSGQVESNFNAPSAICRAAVLYVFRTLVDDDIPLNDGCLRPIDLVIPEASLLNPRPPAAVVAGNVETSQVVVDALYGALGVLAASQGTMNNFTFGDARRQYYETICGGAGAGPDFDGASAVQTHMTNSRLTDPEVLESRYPVLVDTFAIRRGSGGEGRFGGGDGVVRRVRFRGPMTASLLSNRRRVAPFGLQGGEAGDPGRAWVERAAGRRQPLAATDTVQVEPGDAIVIETPGGGGFGCK